MAEKLAPTVRDPKDLFQRDTHTIVKRLASVAITNGDQIDGIKVSTTTLRVPHSLGRPYKGFHIVGKNATCDVWIDDTAVSTPDRAINLKASASATISIWIY